MNKIFKLLVVVCLSTSMLIGCSSATDVEDDVVIPGTSGNEAIDESDDITETSDNEAIDESEVIDLEKSSSEEYEKVKSNNFVYNEWNNYTLTVDGRSRTVVGTLLSVFFL